MTRLAVLICVLFGLAPDLNAQLGGVALYEVGTPDMGMSAAGATARAEDAGTVFWNPAGMPRIHGHELSLGLALLIADQKLDLSANTVPPTPGETNEGGNFGGVAPLVGTYFLYSATEDVKLGVAINGLWGGNVDYDSGWIDRLYTTKGSLGGLNFQPTVGVRINDWLSAGAGLNIIYAKLELEARIGTSPIAPSVKVRDADDWGYGGSFGLMFEPRESTRLGVVYRTGVDLRLNGDVRTPLPTSVNFESEFKFVQGINVGLYQELTDTVALLADGGWSDWSEFSDWGIAVGPAGGTLDRDWKDTWRAALGLQWRPVDDWTFRSGVSYDSSPIRSKKRLPDIPVGEAWRFSLGTEHDVSETLMLGATYTFIYGGNASYDNATQPPGGAAILDGRHENNYVHIIGATLRVKF